MVSQREASHTELVKSFNLLEGVILFHELRWDGSFDGTGQYDLLFEASL